MKRRSSSINTSNKGRWQGMTKAEKLHHLQRLKHRCVPLGERGFVCFHVGELHWSDALIDGWIAQAEALPDDEQ